MQTQSIIPFPKAEQAPRVLNCLELFAGIRSFGKVAQQFGHRVFSSDFNPLLEDINYCVDIMQFDPRKCLLCLILFGQVQIAQLIR